MNGLRFLLIGSRVLCCLAFCLSITNRVVAQDRDPDAITEDQLQESFDRKIAVTHWALSPSSRAMRLLEDYELVAIGEFVDFSSEEANNQAVIQSRDVVVGFSPTALYKGGIANGVPVDVRLNSDMLSYFGEPISRYEKRKQIRRVQREELERLDGQLAALSQDSQDGRIAAQEFLDEEERLRTQRQTLIDDSLATSTRNVAVIGLETFYDLEGVIQPGVEYLVGLNRTPDALLSG